MQPSAESFYLRPQADEWWHASPLVEKECVLVIILLEIAVCLLILRALFLIFESTCEY